MNKKKKSKKKCMISWGQEFVFYGKVMVYYPIESTDCRREPPLRYEMISHNQKVFSNFQF